MAFPGRVPEYHSAAFVINVVVERYAKNPAHYAFLDVTSAATALAAVRGSTMLEHGVAPIGWRTIVEKISAIQGTTRDEGLSRIRMLLDGSCTDPVCQGVADVLRVVETEFVTAYGKLFSETTKEYRLPGTLLIVAPPDLSAWFSQMLERVDFAQFAISERPFLVQQLYAQHLSSVVSFSEDSKPETGLAVLGAFVHTLASDDR